MKIAREIPETCKSFYCVFQGGHTRDYWVAAQLDAMWAQLAVNIPTVNGFSGNIAPGWAPLSKVFIYSPWDIMRSRINAFQWADLNNLKKEDICVVPFLRSEPQGEQVPLDDLRVVPGTKEADTFFGPGWGVDERDADDVWTWVIGKHAKLFVPLRPGIAYKMYLTVAPMTAPGLQQKASIGLNSMPMAAFALSEGYRTYEIILPSKAVQDLNRLDFSLDYAVSPASLGKAADTRKLSMALTKVRFVAMHDSK